MTDITLEQRARELLAAEWEADGRTMHAGMIRIGHPAILIEGDTQRALRAIEAALRLSAGEDWVLVPREPTPEMLGAFYRMATGADWCPSACNLTKRQLARARKAYAAMLAAAPRHEPGEG